MIARTDDPSQVPPETDSSSVLVNEKAVEFRTLAERALQFQKGVKRIYEGSKGNMWFFELWHYLGDVSTALTAALPFLHPDRDSDGLATALRHIITIPENVPGGMTAADALVAITACAKSAIAKTASAPIPGRDSVIEECARLIDRFIRKCGSFNARQELASAATAIRSLKSTDAPVKGDGWQPIETAPKDGTIIWLWWLSHHPDSRQIPGWWISLFEWEGFIDHCDSEPEGQPTHWRPLPAPPVKGEEK